MQALLEVKAGGGGGVKEEEEELEWLSNKDAFPAVETMAPAAGARPRKRGKRGAASSATGRRRCRHCGTEKTPQWREGPEGPHTLCNACGVRHRAGRLLPEYRPLSSPTFRPELHSNCHRRVLAMRRRHEERDSAKALAAGEEKKRAGQEMAETMTAFSGDQELVETTRAFSCRRPRTTGLRRPRRVVGWNTSPPPSPRAPASGGATNSIHLWRSAMAQRVAASAGPPIAGGAPWDEVGLGVSGGGLVKRPPLGPQLAPASAPTLGKRHCGVEEMTRQALASPGLRVCWNCGAEQTPPAPTAAKPATGQQPIGMEKTPRASAAMPAGQLLCGSRGAKKTPHAPAIKPAASVVELLREHRETKNRLRAQEIKPEAAAE